MQWLPKERKALPEGRGVWAPHTGQIRIPGAQVFGIWFTQRIHCLNTFNCFHSIVNLHTLPKQGMQFFIFSRFPFTTVWLWFESVLSYVFLVRVVMPSTILRSSLATLRLTPCLQTSPNVN